MISKWTMVHAIYDRPSNMPKGYPTNHIIKCCFGLQNRRLVAVVITLAHTHQKLTRARR